MDQINTGIAIASFIAIYFAPTLVAWYRHYQLPSVFTLNLLLGWTLLGWIIALVMALRDKPQIAQSAH